MAPYDIFDFNADGVINNQDIVQATNSIGYEWQGHVVDTQFVIQVVHAAMGWSTGSGQTYEPPLDVSTVDLTSPDIQPDPNAGNVYSADTTQGISMPATQQESGISSSPIGTRQELARMLQAYKSRTSLIQGAIRQKAIFTVDRFDGGLNQSAAPRDISYWEACQMDCLSPAKAGRLIRLGDFGNKISASSGNGLESFNGDSTAVIENYGLHYFKWSNEKDLGASGTPTNYIAMQDGDDINIWDLSDDTTTQDVITSLNASAKPVYHSASNRLYVSDATFASSKTYMCGIVDRRKLFPYDNSGALAYNITGDSHLFTDESLLHAAPTKGVGDTHVMVTGTQANHTTQSVGGVAISGLSNAAAQHQGIYININFETISGDESNSTGWGSDVANGDANDPGSGTKYYKFYASFLYDEGSETKLTDVTSADNDVGDDKVAATTGTSLEYQKMVIKQVYIDGAGIVASNPRVHGARFYYTEVDASGNPIGNDKFMWAELDFRYGFQLATETGHWHQFDDETVGTDTQAIQVLNARSDDGNADEANGTLEILFPPQNYTYYTLNLFTQEELKDDLMWKTSTVGNGIAFIGNIEYDGRQYPDTMLYSGAGEVTGGSVYPMWGTFPVDSNRIDLPGASGEITALKWTSNKVLQFRKNSLFVINVEVIEDARIEGVYQGMGVFGQYAVTETPFGVAWVNENGAYAYNSKEQTARSLTIGRLDTEDFGADSNSKIGYDDRAKMLVITNTDKSDTDGYHYAYSFVTDSWCTWNNDKGKSANVKTNFAIDHDGYLTGAANDGSTASTINVYRWSAIPSAVVTVDYISKDFDFGKPNLDKRFYTIYISFTGGASQASMFVYFRVNGMEGTDLTNGWTKLGTVSDYTNPYGANQGSAWGTSADGSTTLSGEPFVPTAVDDLDSTDVGDVQKLAKINLRHFGDSVTLPDDYLKFARSIQLRITGTAATTFEINDISLVFKEKRIK